MRFHSGQYQLKVPFAIYSDLEAILEKPLQGFEEVTELYGSPISEASYTKRINCLVASRFCTYSACTSREVKDLLKLYRGKDCRKRLTQEEWREFNRVTKSQICFNDFEEDNKFNYKVTGHCHYMGLHRGPAHRICSLR